MSCHRTEQDLIARSTKLLLWTLFKSYKFHFGITTITPLTTLVILVTSTQHAHLTLRVSLRLAKRPSAQFANSTNKNLQTRIYEQGSTNKILQTRTTFKHRSRYSPTSSQGRALVKQASIVAYLTRFAVNFFPTICSTRENQKKYY